MIQFFKLDDKFVCDPEVVKEIAKLVGHEKIQVYNSRPVSPPNQYPAKQVKK